MGGGQVKRLKDAEQALRERRGKAAYDGVTSLLEDLGSVPVHADGAAHGTPDPPGR